MTAATAKSLRELAAIKNDYLACVKFNGQYAYLARSLAAWRTRSQFDRDPVAIHNIWLMHRHGVSIHFQQPEKEEENKTTTTTTAFKSKRELIYYEAMQFLLGSNISTDLPTLWHRWQRATGSGDSGGSGSSGIAVTMPDDWLGPPVLF